MIKMIFCIDQQGAIGKNNELLYNLPKDMARFKELTTGHIVVMGFNTFKSLGFKPLPNRHNIVIYQNQLPVQLQNRIDIQLIHESVARDTILTIANSSLSDVWIIGGRSVYEMFYDCIEEIHQTVVVSNERTDGNIFFPDKVIDGIDADVNLWDVIHLEITRDGQHNQHETHYIIAKKEADSE